MKGIQLKFYVQENRKHEGILLYEWLLEKAKRLNLQGGSAFRSIAGYGRHGALHQEHFFELAANLPVEVIFILTEEECGRFLKELENEKLGLFYVKASVEFDLLN